MIPNLFVLRGNRVDFPGFRPFGIAVASDVHLSEGTDVADADDIDGEVPEEIHYVQRSSEKTKLINSIDKYDNDNHDHLKSSV